MDLFKCKIHSLDEVKNSLSEDGTRDFFDLLENHPDFTYESISILLGKKA